MCIYMKMVMPRLRPRVLLARPQHALADAIRPFLSLVLAAALIATPASPQFLASPQASSTATTTTKTSEPSAPRPDKSRAQTFYQAGRRAEKEGDWKTAYSEIGRASC